MIPRLAGIGARLSRTTVSRPAVVAAAALILLLPGALVLAGTYRTDGQARVIHLHTGNYTVYNGINGTTGMTTRADDAIADWGNHLSDRNTVAMNKTGVASTAKVKLFDENLPDTEAAVLWSECWHQDQGSLGACPSQPTRVDVDFDASRESGWTSDQKKHKACKVLGNILGLADQTDGPSCMNAGTDNPDVYGGVADDVDAFYGPNIDTFEGTLLDNADSLSENHSYNLHVVASGHGLKALEIQIDGQRLDPADYWTLSSCNNKCTLDKTITVDGSQLVNQFGDGQHTIKARAWNQFGTCDESPLGQGHCATKSQAVFDRADTGVQRQFRFVTQRLSDRTTVGVNVANGNLVLAENDLGLAGVGPQLLLARYWNSLSSRSTDFGPGWSMSMGEGVKVQELSPSGDVRFFGPTGYDVLFKKHTCTGCVGYDSPTGLDANLTKNGDGTWEIKFLRSEQRFKFESSGRLTDVIDRNDHKVSFAYDAQGKIQSATQVRNPSSESRTVTFSYYQTPHPAAGLINSMTDPTGRKWQYAYDPTTRRLVSYTNPNGELTQYLYDGQGRVSDVIVPRESGVDDTTIAYDSSGHVRSITRDATSDHRVTETFEYHANDPDCTNDVAGDDDLTTRVTDPNGHATIYCIDRPNRVNEVRDALGHKVEVGYTPDSNVETYALDAGDSDLGRTWSFAYDTQDRLTKATQPGGDFTKLTYNTGNASFRPDVVEVKTGPAVGGTLLSTVNLCYDGLGNLTDVLKSGTCALPGTTLLSLDRAESPSDPDLKGLVQSATDGNGNRTDFTYGSRGYLTQATPPGPAGPIKYRYDGVGRLKALQDGNGQTREILYDGLDRSLTIAYLGQADIDNLPVNPPLDDSMCYGYDGAGNLRLRSNNCHTDRSEDTDHFDYDGLNQMTDAKFRNAREVRYAYDDAGNLTTLDDIGPQGQDYGAVTYTYNEVNLVKTIQEPGKTCPSQCFAYQYNRHDQPTQITFPNGMVEANTYGNHRLLTSTVTKGGTELSHLLYRYDLDRTGDQSDPSVNDLTPMITEIKDTTAGGVTTDYDYDDLLRLKKATESGASSDVYEFTYDGASNLKTQKLNGQTTTYAYNAANELTGDGTNSYCYDSAGNLTKVLASGTCASPVTVKLALSYDRRERTQTITQGGSQTPFDYADAGQSERILKNSLEFTDNLLGLGTQDSTHGNNPTFFTRNPDTGEALAMRVSGDQNYYFVSNSRRSVIALTDAQGTRLTRYRYTPYGKPIGSPPPPSEPIRFQGAYLDTETGLYAMRARYYDPAVGRFTQADPISAYPSYAFAGEDPITNRDPSGLLLAGNQLVACGTEACLSEESAASGGGGGAELAGTTAAAPPAAGISTFYVPPNPPPVVTYPSGPQFAGQAGGGGEISISCEKAGAYIELGGAATSGVGIFTWPVGGEALVLLGSGISVVGGGVEVAGALTGC